MCAAQWRTAQRNSPASCRCAATGAFVSVTFGAVALIRAATLTWMFWHTRGHLREGRGWLEKALSAGVGPPALRARALNRAGWLALFQGDYEAAMGLVLESLTLSRAGDDREGVASALTNLGFVATLGQRDDLPLPLPALLKEAIGLRPYLTDRRTVANLLILGGLAAGSQRDWEPAVARHDESLALYRELRDAQGMSMCLGNLGLIALGRGRYDEAVARLRENLQLAREAEPCRTMSYQEVQ